MKASTSYDVTGKARIYHTLAQMSSSFSSIVRYCEDLEQAGVLHDTNAAFRHSPWKYRLRLTERFWSTWIILRWMIGRDLAGFVRSGRNISDSRQSQENAEQRRKPLLSGLAVFQLPNYSITKF
jgi:hypothetical protein